MLDINVKATSNSVEITGEIGGSLSVGAIMAILKGIKKTLKLDKMEWYTMCTAIALGEECQEHDFEEDK